MKAEHSGSVAPKGLNGYIQAINLFGETLEFENAPIRLYLGEPLVVTSIETGVSDQVRTMHLTITKNGSPAPNAPDAGSYLVSATLDYNGRFSTIGATPRVQVTSAPLVMTATVVPKGNDGDWDDAEVIPSVANWATSKADLYYVIVKVGTEYQLRWIESPIDAKIPTAVSIIPPATGGGEAGPFGIGTGGP